MPSARDPYRNEEFLILAASQSASGEFVAHASARLETGDEKFGDRWASLPIGDFFRELAEEGADLGAWAALAAQRLAQPAYDSLEDDTRRALLYNLRVVGHLGACAHREIERSRVLLTQAAERAPEEFADVRRWNIYSVDGGHDASGAPILANRVSDTPVVDEPVNVMPVTEHEQLRELAERLVRAVGSLLDSLPYQAPEGIAGYVRAKLAGPVADMLAWLEQDAGRDDERMPDQVYDQTDGHA